MKIRAQHLFNWLASLRLVHDNDDHHGENVERMLTEKLQNGSVLCHLMNLLKPAIVEKV